MPKRSWSVLILGLAVVAAGWLVLFSPWLGQTRQVADSSPGLQPLFARSEIAVPPRQSACVGPVRFDAEARRVAVIARAIPGGGPLRISASAPGYRTTVVAPVPGTDVDEQIIATLPVHVSSPVDGHICLKNLGRKSVALIGTNEPRSLTLARTTVHGKRSAGDARATLLILTAADRSPGGSFGELSRHLSTLSGGIAPVWIIWILAILLVVGVPVAALLALALASRPAP